MRKNKKTINWIAGATIISGLALIVTVLIFLPQIKTNFPKTNPFANTPFTVKLSPQYFDQGSYNYNYDKIPFSIEINKKVGTNITYLKLSKENFKVSRRDGGLDKPMSDVNWKNSRSNDIVSYGSLNQNYLSYGYFPLKAEGKMNLCENCFIGTAYPYLFTFTIYYKENGKESKSKTFNEVIPIR